jgi:hypothetical protein
VGGTALQVARRCGGAIVNSYADTAVFISATTSSCAADVSAVKRWARLRRLGSRAIGWHRLLRTVYLLNIFSTT